MVILTVSSFTSMAEDAVNAAITYGGLSPSNSCVTKELRLIGGEEWDPALFTVLSQNYVRMKKSYGGKIMSIESPLSRV